jgi:hypothetical protein
MSDDRRNPYLILGVPYGVSKDEARRAAARRSRQVKQLVNPHYALDDVTWALHQVEQVIVDPSSGVDVFRVPASAGILDAPVGQGLFRAPIMPLPRTSPSTSDEEVAALKSRALEHIGTQALDLVSQSIDCRPPDPVERSS